MTVSLGIKLVRKLAKLPESGMGYQVVDLVLSDGRKLKNVVVFNSEQAEIAEGVLGQAKITDVELSSSAAGR